MSGNSSAPKPKPKIDRRVLRTRERLGDALIELIQQKPFDSITVQDVLDRAEVGRATFYTHYRDKNDLFVSDVDEFLEVMATHLSKSREDSERVAPVRELFAHVADSRTLYDALVVSGHIQNFLELARAHFACGIETRFDQIPKARDIPRGQRAALAQAHAGALLALLTWWLTSGTPSSPIEMDEFFHRMLWNGVSAPNAAM